MDNTALRGLLWLFVMLLSGLVKFSVSETDNYDECGYRLKSAGISEVFADIGVELFKKKIDKEKAFVYSDLQVMRQLLFLLSSGSATVKNRIRSYLSLRGTNCDNNYCKSFVKLMEGMKSSMGGYFDDKTILFRSNKTFGKWIPECGAVRVEDFTGTYSLEYKVNEVNWKFLKQDKFKCIIGHLDYHAVFYLYNGHKLDPAIFGQIVSYNSERKFIDLKGEEHIVEWLGTTGDFWSVTIYLLPIPSDPTLTCKTVVFRAEINGGRQYMLYFMPYFPEYTEMSRMKKCYEEILFNRKIYVQRTIDKTLTLIIEYQEEFTHLLVPKMIINTETDLGEHLKGLMPEIFRGEQITELFKENVTLTDARTCNYFHNTGKTYPKETAPNGYIWYRYVYRPFVFTLVDKKTMAFMKTGVYFEPKLEE